MNQLSNLDLLIDIGKYYPDYNFEVLYKDNLGFFLKILVSKWDKSVRIVRRETLLIYKPIAKHKKIWEIEDFCLECGHSLWMIDETKYIIIRDQDHLTERDKKKQREEFMKDIIEYLK